MAYKTEEISQTIFGIMSAYIYEYYFLLRCKRYLIEAEIIKGKLNIKSEMRSFKSNENIHKKEGGSYYVVSANKASSVTL